MKKLFFILIITFFCDSIPFAGKLYSQSLPVGTPVLEDYYRQMQLLGKLDSNVSFTIKPTVLNFGQNSRDIYNPDTAFKGGPMHLGKHGVFQILPFSWQQQINSDHPYGWNDGPMIPAKGYQLLLSGGFYFRYGPLNIQLRPEYVYAQNAPFNGFASGHDLTEIGAYNIFHNLIDWPERFGENSYKKLGLGQSTISLNFGPMSIGLSNENLWWGPGIQNALVLTNNAAGFKHVTINTIKPIKVIGGYLEGQVIGGKLENSNYPSLLPNSLVDVSYLTIAKKHDWRYLSGFNLNYHPGFIPGLTVGLIRTFNAYYTDVKNGGLKAYIPFFTSYTKVNVNNGVGDLFPRDQITSIYARWLFKKALAEVYLEYGLEDNLYNTTDFIQSPEHSRGYIFGLRKLFQLNRSVDQYISFNTEITQVSQNTEAAIREIGLWYLNYQVLHGHTNEGQVLGAGTGPGGNIQTFDISWFFGLKKIGFTFDRYEHDADFAHTNYADINGNSRNWVDLAFALHGQWSYRNFLFSAKLQGIKSLNYEWILKDFVPDQYYIPHNTVYNFHGELGLTYRF